MFNLFEEEDEPLTESAKFRFLIEKVQNPQLETDISALKVKSGLLFLRKRRTVVCTIICLVVVPLNSPLLARNGHSETLNSLIALIIEKQEGGNEKLESNLITRITGGSAFRGAYTTCIQVNIVVASVDGHKADDQVRTSSKVARGTPKWRS